LHIKNEKQPAIEELQRLNYWLGKISTLLIDNGCFIGDNCTIIDGYFSGDSSIIIEKAG